MPRLIRPRFRGFSRLFPTGSRQSAPSGVSIEGDVQPVADVLPLAAYNSLEGEDANRSDGYYTVNIRQSLANVAGGGSSSQFNPFAFTGVGESPPQTVLNDPAAWCYWLLAAYCRYTLSGGAGYSDVGGYNVTIAGAYPGMFISGFAMESLYASGQMREDTTSAEGSFGVRQSAEQGWVPPAYISPRPFPLFDFNDPGIIARVWNTNQGGGLGTVQYDIGILGKYMPRGVPWVGA